MSLVFLLGSSEGYWLVSSVASQAVIQLRECADHVVTSAVSQTESVDEVMPRGVGTAHQGKQVVLDVAMVLGDASHLPGSVVKVQGVDSVRAVTSHDVVMYQDVSEKPLDALVAYSGVANEQSVSQHQVFDVENVLGVVTFGHDTEGNH